MKQFDILTLFPDVINAYFSESIIKRARKKKLITTNVHDFRKFTTDKHRTVDDRPYGGGPGMVLKVEPIYKCLQSIKKKKKSRVILLTPKGESFTQKKAQSLTKYDQLILISGHYEGFDARIKKYVDEELSIGDFVLTGGEVPAMAVVDAVTRLLPGTLGDDESPKDETFTKSEKYIEYPHYTRPESFKSIKVPKVLLSGDHKKIAEWRRQNSKVRKA